MTAKPSAVGVRATEAALPRRSFVAQIMGLPMSVHVRGPLATSAGVAGAVEAAFDALRADEAMFSTWRPESPVSRIKAGLDLVVEAHPRIRHVAALCELAGHRTGGAFAAWLPGSDGRSHFDPTGLVKGWSVDEAFTALLADLRPFGRHDALICAGGDIAVACSRTDTPDWVVAVEDPRDRSRTLRSFRLRTGAVATSGTAARGDHIVDPATGAAATGLLSATIVGPNLTWADVYATAAFVKGTAALPWIATLPAHAGLLVGADGTVRTVSGICPELQETRGSSLASTG